MNKQMAICLRCGKVQVRTDLGYLGNAPYIVLQKSMICPRCGMETKHIATKDIKMLKKQLTDSIYKPLDTYIFHLIKE